MQIDTTRARVRRNVQTHRERKRKGLYRTVYWMTGREMAWLISRHYLHPDQAHDPKARAAAMAAAWMDCEF
jgi:hypothetical protein